jgi:hypothetical protein
MTTAAACYRIRRFSGRDRFLGGVRRSLGDSCGLSEPPRRDADQALEVMGEVALVGETGARRNLRQRDVMILLKESLGPLNAAGDDVLMRRPPRRDLELPREVVGAEMGDRRQLPQGQAGIEVFLDILDNRVEPGSRERSVPPAGGFEGRAVTYRIRWTARTLARDSEASGPPAPPAFSSVSTAAIAARRCGRCSPSSGGTLSRAGSRSNASAATRETKAASRKMCSSSLCPLERAPGPEPCAQKPARHGSAPPADRPIQAGRSPHPSGRGESCANPTG